MNEYKPHLKILCEDEINQNFAKGFILGLNNHQLLSPQIETIKDVTGGWNKAVNDLNEVWLEQLRQNNHLFLLILIIRSFIIIYFIIFLANYQTTIKEILK